VAKPRRGLRVNRTIAFAEFGSPEPAEFGCGGNTAGRARRRLPDAEDRGLPGSPGNLRAAATVVARFSPL